MDDAGVPGDRRIVVADRFPLIRTTIANLLGQRQVAEVVGEADSPGQALAVCREHCPDILVTDVDLTDRGDGIELCRMVKKMAVPPLVLMFSSVNDPQVIAECVSSGADSFVHRSAQLEVLVSAVAMIDGVPPVWYPGNRAGTAVENKCDEIAGSLTEREAEILLLILMRYSNKEIADRLYLAHQTVKNYTRNIFQKFGVANRHEIVARHRVATRSGVDGIVLQDVECPPQRGIRAGVRC